jgi:hypothetical protein
MPRFIAIVEATQHAFPVSEDEIVALIRNPQGYSDVAQCLAMIQAPQTGKYMAFPISHHQLGTVTIHVEGRMDVGHHRLAWKEPGHRCDHRCQRIPPPRRF